MAAQSHRQVILVDKERKLTTESERFAQENANAQVDCICIIGPARSGKSTFLNWIRGEKIFKTEENGFIEGTTGVNMSQELWGFDQFVKRFPNTSYETPTGRSVLLLDAQGSGYEVNSTVKDAKIMIPLLLTCKIVILRYGKTEISYMHDNVTKLESWVKMINSPNSLGYLHVIIRDTNPRDCAAYEKDAYDKGGFSRLKPFFKDVKVTVLPNPASSTETHDEDFCTLKLDDRDISSNYREAFKLFMCTISEELRKDQPMSFGDVYASINQVFKWFNENDISIDSTMSSDVIYTGILQARYKKAEKNIRDYYDIPKAWEPAGYEKDKLDVKNELMISNMNIPSDLIDEYNTKLENLVVASRHSYNSHLKLRIDRAVKESLLNLERDLNFVKTFINYDESAVEFFKRYTSGCLKNYRSYAKQEPGHELKEALEHYASLLRGVYEENKWYIDEANYKLTCKALIE